MSLESKNGFTIKQTKFLAEYAKTDNLSEACRVAGINRSTGYKYLDQPDIKNEIEGLRTKIINAAWLKLSNNMEKAVDTLSEVINSPNASTNSKLRATELILNYTARYTDNRDIIARMERLEDNINAE